MTSAQLLKMLAYKDVFRSTIKQAKQVYEITGSQEVAKSYAWKKVTVPGIKQINRIDTRLRRTYDPKERKKITKELKVYTPPQIEIGGTYEKLKVVPQDPGFQLRRRLRKGYPQRHVPSHGASA